LKRATVTQQHEPHWTAQAAKRTCDFILVQWKNHTHTAN